MCIILLNNDFVAVYVDYMNAKQMHFKYIKATNIYNNSLNACFHYICTDLKFTFLYNQ